MDEDRSLSLGTEVSASVPPPSPLTGCYLLAVIGEPHTHEHKEIILQRLVKAMPYKIIQTLEKGRAVLTSIPNSWENEGILSWPKKYAEKLKTNDQNQAQDNWLKSECKLKRKNILTYEEAEKEVERMCNQSDTEHDENEDPCQTKKRKKINLTSFYEEDFNSLAQQCITESDSSRKSTKKTDLQEINNLAAGSTLLFTNGSASEITNATVTDLTLDAVQNTLAEVDSSGVDILSSTIPAVDGDSVYLTGLTLSTQDSMLNSRFDVLTEKVDSIAAQLEILLENQKKILVNQQHLYESSQSITLQQVKLDTKFEEIIKKCSPKLDGPKKIDFKIIESQEDAEALEVKLKDTAFKKELLEKFSVVCGKDKGKGINNAYVLIDLIFSRNFMKQCSWAGGSRNETQKVCFRAFTRIIEFFSELVRETDKNFTTEDCKTFIKNILRNSVSRSNCKQIRASTSRNRPTKPKTGLNNAQSEASRSASIDLPGTSEQNQLSNSDEGE